MSYKEEACKTVEAAFRLMDYAVTITENSDRYPGKYKRLVEHIQDECFDIYIFSMDANRTNLITDRKSRIDLQTKVINACDKLSGFVELSYRHKRIGSNTLNHWQKLINNVKYLAIAWRESNRK